MVTDVTVTLGTEPGPVGQVRVMRRDAPGWRNAKGRKPRVDKGSITVRRLRRLMPMIAAMAVLTRRLDGTVR